MLVVFMLLNVATIGIFFIPAFGDKTIEFPEYQPVDIGPEIRNKEMPLEMGEFEKAMQIYVTVLESHPEDIESLMAIGHICEAAQKSDDADVFYNRVLQIEPWNLEAQQKRDALNVNQKAI